MFKSLRQPPVYLMALLAAGFAPAVTRAGDAPDEGEDRAIIVTKEKVGSGPEQTKVIRLSGRPMLGLIAAPSHRAENADGAEVLAVTPGSPAAEAGIKNGDIILKANGRKLSDYDKPEPGESATDWRGLMEFSTGLKEGDRVTLDYRRGADPLSAAMTAHQLPPGRIRVVKRINGDGVTEQELVTNEDEDQVIELSGTPRTPGTPGTPEPSIQLLHGLPGGFMDLELTALNPDLADYFGTRSGVLVTRVPEGSALPLKSGDVLTRIGDERDLKSPGQALRALRGHASGEKVAVDLVRHGKPMTISLVMPERKIIIHREGLPTPKPDAK